MVTLCTKKYLKISLLNWYAYDVKDVKLVMVFPILDIFYTKSSEDLKCVQV